jgi:HD-GYP domain-containing protein (c-di-GMP phosphodiesterase class II)
LSVVDSFDAMTSDRPYRAALPPAEAVRRLRDGVGTQWDPEIVSVFVETVDSVGHSADMAAVGDERR